MNDIDLTPCFTSNCLHLSFYPYVLPSAGDDYQSYGMVEDTTTMVNAPVFQPEEGIRSATIPLLPNSGVIGLNLWCDF